MSNSIGDLNNSGLKGNNWPWQYKVLLGLDKIVAAIGGTEYEAQIIKATCPGPTPASGYYLEVRIYNTTTGTFGAPVYYLPGSTTPVNLSACTKEYANDSLVLTQIYTELLEQGLTLDAIETAVEGTLTVQATDLDIRTLTCDDTVSLCFDNAGTPTTVSDTNPLPVNAVVTVPTPLPVSQDPTSNPWTVDATDLDIRALDCNDKVSLCNNGTIVDSSNPLPVDAGALTPSADGVGMYGSTDGGTNWTAVQVDTNGVVSTNTTIVGPIGNQDCDNSVAVSLCTAQAQDLVDIKTAVQGTLDVNIVSSIELEVNLDPNNDAVTIYGSNPTVPVSTDGAGHLQVDVLTIPEVEIKNDAGNPIPVSGTVTANQGTNPWVVGQLTHDNLNANANIQVNNTDVSATNPVPVLQQYPGTVPYASCEVATGTGTTPVVFSAGATSMSVQNLGNDNITVDTDSSTGVILPPGVSITWDAPVGQRFDTFTFTGSSVSSLFIVTAVIAS